MSSCNVFSALQAQQKELSAADNSDDSISVSSIDQKSNPEVSANPELRKVGTKRCSTSAEISDTDQSKTTKKVARLEPEVANGIEQDEPLDLSRKARAESERIG